MRMIAILSALALALSVGGCVSETETPDAKEPDPTTEDAEPAVPETPETPRVAPGKVAPQSGTNPLYRGS